MEKGDTVVCIKGTNSGSVKKNETYTISWVGYCRHTGKPGVRLQEATPCEPFINFSTKYFRKLESRTNALSRQLAAEVIWREMVQYPGLQEQEINPKVFTTKEDF